MDPAAPLELHGPTASRAVSANRRGPTAPPQRRPRPVAAPIAASSPSAPAPHTLQPRTHGRTPPTPTLGEGRGAYLVDVAAGAGVAAGLQEEQREHDTRVPPPHLPANDD